MIVQCQACQTRFRLANEKIKPGGTKVRCSKCKEIFTVTLPEPEPAEESVDFGSFNMEPVAEETPDETTASAGNPEEGSSEPMGESFEPEAEPAAAAEPEERPVPADESLADEIDFSSLEEEMGSAVASGEIADEFSFADISQSAGDDETSTDTDFDAAAEETGGPVEFDFGEDSSPTGKLESTTQDSTIEEEAGVEEFTFESTDDEPTGPSEFTFAEDEESTEESPEGEPADFAFDDPNDKGDDNAFSFDDETPAAAGQASEWGDESPAGDSFDFDEPRFDTDPAEPQSPPKASAEGGLQFGEIDFSSDDEDSGVPNFQTDNSFPGAIMEKQPEPEPFPRHGQTPPAARDFGNVEPLPVPPPPKKSSLSRILLLLVLLLVVLGGAAGFQFMQEGSLNLNAVTEYLPFLKDYIGETQEVAPAERIGINISSSSYVNGQAGQMLVIQGTAVNNDTSRRSSITIKGTLLDANGTTLLQQTVFCGNALDDATLARMPFSAIEEAMNNEFGDSLSNMNIASGGSIPFTIVFRNLPSGIANINVEVVDSKSGAG